MDNNVNEISIIKGGKTDNPKALSIDHFNNLKKLKRKDHQEDQTKYPAYFHLIISICYAFFIAFGSIIWFYLLSLMIVRFRQLINIRIISVFIKSLGAVLCLFGLFFAYMSTRMFIPRWNENMNAAKENFLFKGYYNRKAKAAVKASKDSLQKIAEEHIAWI